MLYFVNMVIVRDALSGTHFIQSLVLIFLGLFLTVLHFSILQVDDEDAPGWASD